MKISRILVPISGDVDDADSVEFACFVAKRYKAKVYVVYVIEVKRTMPLDAEMEPEIEKGEALMETASQIAERSDYEIETELLQAREASVALVDEAVERGIDVIIVGIPYKKRYGEFNLGSIVPYLLKNAPCRVWVLRDPMDTKGLP